MIFFLITKLNDLKLSDYADKYISWTKNVHRIESRNKKNKKKMATTTSSGGGGADQNLTSIADPITFCVTFSWHDLFFICFFALFLFGLFCLKLYVKFTYSRVELAYEGGGSSVCPFLDK